MSLFAFAVVMVAAMTLLYPWTSGANASPLHKTECDSSDVILEMCQRCAKATKSRIVYPMCCRDQEEARHWCSQYLHFGIHGPEDLLTQSDRRM